MFKKEKGFTLVEIVIVIAIIGILAAVTVVALKPQEIFANGRNSRRTNDVAAINSGIGQWLSREGLQETDPYSTLGLTGGTITALTPADGTIVNEGVAANTVTGIVTAGYLQSIPTDPDNSTQYRVGVDNVSTPTHILVCTNMIEHTSTYPESTYPTDSGTDPATGIFCQSN